MACGKCPRFSTLFDEMRNSACLSYTQVLIILLSPFIAPSIIHQTDQDWMKPGTRADREEMVRILVEDLKADVNVLDMHDYR